MPVRASWHQPVVVVDEDPFAAPIEAVGVPVPVRGKAAELGRELVSNVREVRRLKDRGVTCAIRDREETSCSACPIACQDVREPLCRASRRQEEIVTMLAVLEFDGS